LTVAFKVHNGSLPAMGRWSASVPQFTARAEISIQVNIGKDGYEG